MCSYYVPVQYALFSKQISKWYTVLYVPCNSIADPWNEQQLWPKPFSSLTNVKWTRPHGSMDGFDAWNVFVWTFLKIKTNISLFVKGAIQIYAQLCRIYIDLYCPYGSMLDPCWCIWTHIGPMSGPRELGTRTWGPGAGDPGPGLWKKYPGDWHLIRRSHCFQVHEQHMNKLK